MNHEIKKNLNFIVADTPVQFTQKCSNNLSDLNILGIDCTIVIFVTQYSKKLNQTVLNTITGKGRVQINAKFESSHFWCPRKSQHTSTQMASQPKLISHTFLQLGAAYLSSLCFFQPSLSAANLTIILYHHQLHHL